ncbi:hypothetical protein TWF730_010228 [Orbilia blumenaviensis]|uniref:tRNA wybutosine-synthesizing protein 2 n=1 Tax=Orbilia blumenaviensis TaxID=1796055 RepID=A0AAV9UQ59_9PEZI
MSPPPPPPSRPPKPPKPHPSIAAISKFLSTLPQNQKDISQPPPLPSKLRYDIYGSLLLLPPTSPLTTPPWSTYISSLPMQTKSEFFATLARSLNVTHIAVNSPIALKTLPSNEEGNNEEQSENYIRAPRITPLYGSFSTNHNTNSNDENVDFNTTFWTSTTQHGIIQIWAPLYTMFSRGNITEKARIHDIVSSQLKERTGNGGVVVAAVDLFVGIGYFAFSYLKAGVDVVYGWDINAWSVEGCRRGAGGNGWTVKVASSADATTTTAAVGDVEGEEGERLVIFHESNEHAPARLRAIKSMKEKGGVEWPHIMHVNLGLLPTSSGAYKTAVEILSLNEDKRKEAWVHVHENGKKEGVQEMGEGIVRRFRELAGEVCEGEVEVEVEHVEFVKSWAPGVWHCVFDVKVLWR